MNTDTATAARNFVNAHLDILEAAMARWSCGPEEALARLQALQAQRDALTPPCRKRCAGGVLHVGHDWASVQADVDTCEH